MGLMYALISEVKILCAKNVHDEKKSFMYVWPCFYLFMGLECPNNGWNTSVLTSWGYLAHPREEFLK